MENLYEVFYYVVFAGMISIIIYGTFKLIQYEFNDNHHMSNH